MNLLIKTIGYRTLSAAAVYLLTGSLAIALGLEVIKIPLYLAYEWAWDLRRGT